MLMKQMAELPPDIFLITDGSRGVYAYDRKQFYHAKPLSGLTVVETTGAGDAFASTFTAAWIQGKSMHEALHLAMTNAESVLQYKGAKSRLLTKDELLETAARSQREIESSDLS
jgi:ribokinase